MRCIPLPAVPDIELPAGFSLSPPQIAASVTTPNICCIMPVSISIKIAIPLPPFTVNPAFTAALREGLAAIKALIAKIPHKCPRT